MHYMKFAPSTRYEESVPLARIDDSDGRTRLSWELDSPLLTQSIEACGLICPLLLREREDGMMIVVCGFRRLASCRTLGLSTIQARIIQGPVSDLQALVLAFWDNLSHRVFNPVEAAAAVRKFSRHLDKEQLITDVLPLLGLHPHERELKRYLAIDDLPRGAKAGLAEGTLALDAALSILDIPEADRPAVTRFVSGLKLGANKQKEIIQLLYEIHRREDIAPTELIGHLDISDIEQQSELSRPQKSALIRQWLKKRRYPLLSGAEEDFAAWLQSLHLKNTISVKHPPFFEGQTRRVEFSAKTHEELGQALETLSKLYEQGKLEPLFQEKYGI